MAVSAERSAADAAALLGLPDRPAGSPVDAGGWQALAVLEIANFATLRRYLGTRRADRLILDVAERVSLHIPDAQIGIIGRHTIEIKCELPGMSATENLLSSLKSAFDPPLNLDG